MAFISSAQAFEDNEELFNACLETIKNTESTTWNREIKSSRCAYYLVGFFYGHWFGTGAIGGPSIRTGRELFCVPPQTTPQDFAKAVVKMLLEDGEEERRREKFPPQLVGRALMRAFPCPKDHQAHK